VTDVARSQGLDELFNGLDTEIRERILHVHLLGPEDEEARREIAALKRRISSTISALAVARGSLVLRVWLTRNQEKILLNSARRFRRLLVWLER
jgi:hypothetical protein